MINITYPTYKFKIQNRNSKNCIYDEIRRNWFVLTPEEWVRQNFIRYLVDVKKYPESLIAIEKEIKINELKKRFDIVVYKEAIPWMIIECKQLEVKLTENVLSQILTYNTHLQAKYLAITNGNATFLWQKNGMSFSEMLDFPAW